MSINVLPINPTAKAGIDRLIAGNRRFIAGHREHIVDSALRAELTAGQSPFAVVLGCSDSRVPIETIFDEAPGNLFVIRIAGNIVNEDALASMEYAIDILHSSLVFVLGHTGCGAVQAAVQHVTDGTIFPGHIHRLADAIAPAAYATKAKDGDWMYNAVLENARLNAHALCDRSSILATAIDRGAVGVAAAFYDLHSGRVRFLDHE